MITVEDWALIRRLHGSEGMAQAQIARDLGLSRNTVAKACGKLSQGVPGFCGTLAVKLIQAPPYDPETKGVVERANGYLRTSFLPGRSFTSPADFNTQLAAWLSIANAREHRVTRRRPVDALAADRAAMAPLPPMPPAVGTTITTRLGRDYYVGVGGSSYSVHPDAIGRMITVRSTLVRVQAFCDHRLMADHPRVWGTSALITDPVHVGQAKMLRAQCNSTHRDASPSTPVEVEVADLSAYDTVFGTGEVA
ncbi:hypothetical protein R4P47_23505 [Rhodococcus sp. IEGM 1370]|uniref:Mu transposase domain-containing protein n=1 Tax=Rhodococcus sp. IEGM 1370 TaxID=3082222 RepID=UPI0029556D6A|nr:hypothetical protein [Rhodococcus sp. IEGM 1370]MDV8079541.1 hypothetical protein [Rhodococcus sp. IEGM 1370]